MRMDSIVGTIIKQLKDDGLYDNTIIFFYSDHGDALPFVKREVYDRGLRVPMIVRIPEKFRVKGSKPAGSIDNQLISFVDLAPTILSLARYRCQVIYRARLFWARIRPHHPENTFLPPVIEWIFKSIGCGPLETGGINTTEISCPKNRIIRIWSTEKVSRWYGKCFTTR